MPRRKLQPPTVIDARPRCLNGSDPDALFRVEANPGFTQFWRDERLDEWARAIVAKRIPDFPQDVKIVYLWKSKGGIAASKPTLGKCIKAAGLVEFALEGADFVIWLAADHVDGLAFTNFKTEALLYHELLHVTEVEDDDGKKMLGVVGHDFEGFVAEIRDYGFWADDVAAIARVVQYRLDLEGLPAEPAPLDLSAGLKKIADLVVDGDDGTTATIHDNGDLPSAEEVEAAAATGSDLDPEPENDTPYDPENPVMHVYREGAAGNCYTCGLEEGEEHHTERKVPATPEEAEQQAEAEASLAHRK